MAKREEILDAALGVIARNGYRGTSVREIAAAVELSQAGLMHHFASKDELFTEILRRRDEVDEALMPKDLPLGTLDVFPQVIRHNAEVPGLVQLFVSFAADAVGPDHYARPFFVQRHAHFRKELAQAIEQGQESGALIESIVPDAAARELLALADGLQTQWLLGQDFDMADIISARIDSWRTGR